MRRLIINADDFGLTSGVNRAVREAHERGILTSATLMANGRSFSEAVEIAKPAAALSTGCHIVLVDGFPVSPAEKIPSLIGSRNHEGVHFPRKLSSFARRAVAGRLAPEDIEAEATAQIRKLQSAGIQVSHIDTHKHTHVFPSVVQPLLRAAQKCGVWAVRNPFEPLNLMLAARSPKLWLRACEVALASRLARQFRRSVAEAGMVTPNGTLGIVATGSLDDKVFQLLMKKMPEGTWELVCHPGYDDEDLRAISTRLRDSRAQELGILLAKETRDLLTQSEIELVSYGALV